MPEPLSNDLRERIVGAVQGGGSIRDVGARFGVSPSSVSNIARLWRRTGSVAPKKMGGDRRSRATEAHGERLLGIVAAAPDLTLEEIRAVLRDDGIAVGYGALWRFFKRHGISVKKTAHAAEQERPDLVAARTLWKQQQRRFDPARLVFIDETWVSTNMARTRGRAARGQRLVSAVPHGHWKTTTFVAACATTPSPHPSSSIVR